MKQKGVLVVVSGFSGAGKGTIMKELIKKPSYALSISATTRNPRVGEVDGKDYFFKTRDEFEKMIVNNELVEYAEYVGNYYGTPKEYVEKMLNEGKDVLLEIEMQGGMKVKEQFPEALLLFITPPSATILYDRLKGRGTDELDVINKRMVRACDEASYMDAYDYLVINDKLEDAVLKVDELIQCQHLQTCNNTENIKKMKEQLKELKKGI